MVIYIHTTCQNVVFKYGFASHEQNKKKGEHFHLAGVVASFNSFLQMVVVWQNLHQKVELKSLGLRI